MNVYLGGSFEYFLGGSDTVDGVDVSFDVWQLQFEGGYDLGILPKLVVRPQLGLGLAGYSGELCTDDLAGQSCEDRSETAFSLAPGVLALYDVGPVFLSLGVRYNAIMTEVSATALFLGVGAGMTF